jgi:GT2 family glycosyltransferase/predicted O-methyltransferase YrrM
VTGTAPTTDQGTIYVLLPVHDRRAITEQFVQCLLDQTDQRFHLVLVDDGSTDGTADGVSALLPNATVLTGDGTWWWAGSLQQAYHWLAERELDAHDLVLIANDDTRFDTDFLAAGRAALAGRPRTMLLAQLFDHDTGEFIELGVNVNWRRLKFTGVKEPDRINCFSTRGLFMAASEFLELGGFHRRLLPHYMSDYEFTIRAHRKGYALVSDPGVRLWLDRTTTGIRKVARTSVRKYLASTLTNRSVHNPIWWSTFLLLASPRRMLPRNLFRVWRRFARGLLRARRGVNRPDQPVRPRAVDRFRMLAAASFLDVAARVAGRRLVPLPIVRAIRRVAPPRSTIAPPTHRFDGAAARPEPLGRLMAGMELGTWAMGPQSVEELVRIVAEVRPELILEFGSGASTVALAWAIRETCGASANPRIVSIEQDLAYADATRALLARMGLADECVLIVEPLTAQVVEGRATTCYSLPGSLPAVLGDRHADLVVIDGPAGPPGVRFATVPLVRQHLRQGAAIVLDDALRDGELEVASQWATLPYVRLKGIRLIEKGLLFGVVTG